MMNAVLEWLMKLNVCDEFLDTPWKINMEPTNHPERKMIFQTSMIMFHVNLQGCIFKREFQSAWKMIVSERGAVR